MIDLHVHSRDAEQAYKETVEHCISVAYRVGVDAMIAMPNTDPTLTSEEAIYDEFKRQDEAIAKLCLEGRFWAGVWAGITPDADQIKEISELYRKHRETDKRIAGGKFYAGKTTGNLSIIEPEKQEFTWHKIVEYGLEKVAAHSGKESEMKPELWDPSNPYTHTLARPPKAEVESVRDMINIAEKAGFKGLLHIVHVSVPAALKLIEERRRHVPFQITCGLTPHHALLYDEMMKSYPGGLPYKMNPPLRPRPMQEFMLKALIDGKINWPESDHAPHTLDEKLGKAKDKKGKPVFASGIPVVYYWPYFIKLLRKHMSWDKIHRLTHGNILKALEIPIPNSRRIEEIAEGEIPDLSGEYEFDAFRNLKVHAYSDDF